MQRSAAQPNSPRSSAEAAPVDPTMLVLRDCLVPPELQLPPHENLAIHFSSGLSDAVAVQIPQLGIDVLVPDRTQVIQATVDAEPGRYTVRARSQQGATYGQGTLIVVAGATMVPPAISDGETAAAATPQAAAGGLYA